MRPSILTFSFEPIRSFVLAAILLLSFNTIKAQNSCITLSVDSIIGETCPGNNDGIIDITATSATPTSGTNNRNIYISEVNYNSPDFIEITTTDAIDVTGYQVVVSNSYSDITLANAITWQLSGTLAANTVLYREDIVGANYWGNNILWASSNNSWVLIIDASGNIVDALFGGWNSADVNNFNTTVGGLTVTNNGDWMGNGVNTVCNTSIKRIPSPDSNTNADWTCAAVTKGINNLNLITYNWSSGPTTDRISGLAAGNYTVSVSNIFCSVTETFTLGIEIPTVYVDANATAGNNDGSSWADAYTNLQDAIDGSCSLAEIWVAAGIYHPTKDHLGNVSPLDPRDKNFHLGTDMKIYGGFDGTETLLSERDWINNVTILSGDFNNDDVITGSGSALSFSNNSENAYNVIVAVNLTGSAIIDGFTVKGGNANDNGTFTYDLQTIYKSRGGGMFNSGADLTINNSTFINNYTSQYGGGIFNNASDPAITNSNFNNNGADWGGGIFNFSSTPIIDLVYFLNNNATFGGGVYNYTASPTITNSTFSNNNANQDGGAILNYSSSPAIINSVFNNNTASQFGGGMRNQILSNSIITNSTFVNNSATTSGGGVYNDDSSPIITNSLFWDNTQNGMSNVAGADITDNNSSSTVTYCITQENSAYNSGTGILNNQNPIFTDASNGDFTLQACSPAITTGDNTAWTATGLLTDLAANPRPQNATVDLGAYEYDGALPVITISTPTVTQPTTCLAGTIVVNATITAGTLEYSIDNGATYQSSNTFNNITVGNYTIKVKIQGTSCETVYGSNPIAISVFQSFLFVDGSATGNNDGSSWADAYTDLQDAIDNNCSGVEIWVAAGTYLPTKDHTGNNSPSNNRNKNFHLSTDMKIYGGFDGTETVLSQRDWVSNVTILSGDFNNNDVVTGNNNTYSISNNSENAYHVLITVSLTTAAVIDGFTIKGGNANSTDLITYQSQIFFKRNGGGIYNHYSSPTITNSTFMHNKANYYGGGLYNDYSSPIITNLICIQNKSDEGGGIYNNVSTSLIRNSIFLYNTASYGGAIHNHESPSTIVNSTFAYNESDFEGGAINNNYASSNSIITNTIFEGNIRNGSNINAGADIYNLNGGSAVVTYCLTQQNSIYGSGTGIINNENPRFVDVANNDFSLQACSPAINMGTTLTNTTDILGNPHVGTVDIGAYEYQGAPFSITVSAPTLTQPDCVTPTGTIVVNATTTLGLIEYSIDNGISYQSSNTFSGLPAGNYNIRARETGSTCIETYANNPVVINTPVIITPSAPTVLQPTCSVSTGTIIINATTTTGTLEYSIDNGTTYQASNTFSGLSTGTYGMEIREQASSCTLSYSHVDAVIDTPVVLTVSAPTVIEPTCNVSTGTIIVNATTTFGTLEYSIDNGTTYQTNNTFSGLVGNYTIVVREQGSLCTEAYASNPVVINTLVKPTFYVNVNATGNNNGSSWADAYTDLQHAIDNNNCAASIWVAAGTYYPTSSPDGSTTDPRDKAFHLDSNMSIFGGFNGTETSFSYRNVDANITILSGDFNNDDVVTGSGSALSIANNSENGYHVLITSSLNKARIDGFTIKSGNANGTGSVSYGSDTFYRANGGGMYNQHSKYGYPDYFFIYNNYFFGNQANNFGAGMYNYISDLSIYNSTFDSNVSNIDGGGLYNDSSAVTIRESSFNNNQANFGGGMYNDSSIMTIKQSSFNNNQANFGGGMYNNTSSTTFTDVLFKENTAISDGGGMYNNVNNPTYPIITNATIVGNSANDGGAIYNTTSTPTINNSIIWNNGNSEISNNGSIPIYNYSIVKGSGGSSSWNSSFGTDGGNNLDINPLFKDEANGDYQLQGCSPAITAGDNAAWSASGGFFRDLADKSRPKNTIIDLGAYEYQTAPIAITLSSVSVPTPTCEALGTIQVIATTTAGTLEYSIDSGATYHSNDLFINLDAGNYNVIIREKDNAACEVTYSGNPVVIAAPAINSIRIYIDSSAIGNNDGTSWANAFTDLQVAIDSSDCGDVLWLAKGTYYPTSSPNDTSSNLLFKAFHINKNIKIYGGFNGVETLLSQRDPAIHITTLSGDMNNDDVITGSGNLLTISNLSDNLLHVLVTTGLNQSALIDGLTLTGGYADTRGVNYGVVSGIYYGSQEILFNNGAGMYNVNSTPVINELKFIGNSGTEGTGIYNSSSSPTITNTVFKNNNGKDVLHNIQSASSISNTIFIENRGRGIYNNQSPVFLDQCQFIKNYGSGIYNNQSDPTITNTRFIENEVGAQDNLVQGGAAIYNTYSSPIIMNTMFSRNVSTYYGGAIYNRDSSPMITNATFSRNKSGNLGGAIYNRNSSPIITNSIFWSNTRSDNDKILGADIYNHQSNPIAVVTHSITQLNSVYSSGTGIINNQDPLFIDSKNDNLSLYAGSPALDAGDNTAWATTGLNADLAGNARPQNTVVDIGAYEGSTALPSVMYVDIDATGNNDGSSWTNAFNDLQDALDVAITLQSIWVAEGTYLPTKDHVGNINPTDNRDKNFHFNKDIQIYGGFDATETLLSQRDWENNITILSGDFMNDDIVTGGGSTLAFSNNTENAYHVLITTNLTSSAIINGFTFKGGNANGSNSVTYQSIVFIRNSGGGIFNYNSSPLITNATFSNNNATYRGGGMDNYESDPLISNATFSNNSADSWGGGMCNSFSSVPIIVNSTFSHNNSEKGGGIFCWDSSPSIVNSIFTYNNAIEGGGMNNQYRANSTITNSTFAYNTATKGGGFYTNTQSTIMIVNSILWENTKNGSNNVAGADIENGNSIITVTHSLTQANSTYSNGSGNINNQDPLFVDAANGDFQLSSCSPAITAGDSAAWMATRLNTDIAANPRPQNSTVDMGALEYQGVFPLLITQVTTQPICSNSTGTIVINTTTTTGTMEFSIDDGISYQTSNTFSGLTAGNYTLKVREQGTSCEETYSNNPVVINSPIALAVIAPTLTQPTCATPTGTIIVNATTSTGLLEYSIDNGSNYQSSSTFSGLAGGNYNIKVREQGSSCEESYGSNPVIIDTAVILTVSAPTVTQPTCATPVGTIVVNATTTIGALEYSIDDGTTYQISSAFSGLIAGSYNIKVREQGSSCEETYSSNPVLIDTAVILTVSAPTVAQPTCSTPTGTIFVNAATTTGTLEYSIDNGSNYQSSSSFSGLAAGNYTIKVREQGSSCEESYGSNPVVIDTAIILAVSAPTVTQPSCTNGTSTGTIEVNATTSLGTLEYSIDNGLNYQLSNTFSGLVAGNYTIKVREQASACEEIYGSNPLVINGVIGPIVSAPAVTQPNCATATTGTIEVNATISSGTLEYSTDNGLNYQLSNTFSGLAAGNYYLKVREQGSSCTVTYGNNPIVINNPVINSIVYVDSSATGNNDGSSWINAFTDLQEGIDISSCNSEIWVAQGTYYPTTTTDVLLTDTRDRVFHLNENRKIYGGFNGTETLLSQRDWITNVTILSGDLNKDDIHTYSGDTLIITNNQENVYHVLIMANITNATEIDGFIITGGNADSTLNSTVNYDGNSFDRATGGGISNDSASPMIQNIIFKANEAIYGAALVNSNSAPKILNTTFIYNNASEYAGAIENVSSQLTITNSIIARNKAKRISAGIVSYINSQLTITNTTFHGNTAGGIDGADIANQSASITINNSVFWAKNTTDFMNFSGSVSISNSIIHGSGGSNNWNSDYGTDGGNNLDMDPLFTDAANGDYSLQACSPAIKAGDNTVWTATGLTNDLAGNPRPQNTTVDMGAYEFQGAPLGGGIAIGVATPISTICSGGTDGLIDLAVSGGTVGNNTSYTFAWSNGATTEDLTGLTAGTYTVTVTNYGGCSVSETFTIEASPEILMDTLITNVTCIGDNDGAIVLTNISSNYCGDGTVAICGGTPSLDTLGAGIIVNTAQSYPAIYGNYYFGSKHQIVYLASELNAMGITGGALISSLGFNVQTVNGSATYNNFNIKMGCTSNSNASSWVTSGLIEVLSPTTHTVAVGWNVHTFDTPYLWDGQSNLVVDVCFNDTSYTENSVTLKTDVGFSAVRYFIADNNSVCSSTGTSGTSNNRPNTMFGYCTSPVFPYTYNWSNGSTDSSLMNLSAGTYTVTVSDFTSCTIKTFDVQSVTPPITIAAPTVTHPCGSAPGTIVVNATTNAGTLEYSIDNGTTYQASNTFNGLGVGSYSIKVRTQGSSCIEAYNGNPVIFNTAPTMTIAVPTLIQPKCSVQTGTVIVNATTSAGTLEYSIDNGTTYQSSNTFSGLSAGSFELKVREQGTSCEEVYGSNPVVLVQPALLVASTSGTNVSCNGGIDGQATANQTGGTSPYTYAWSDGQTTAIATGLSAGNYSVTITDASGCTDSSSVILSQPASLIASASETSPISTGSATDGQATASQTGGTAPYTYSWNTGGTSALETGLGAGTYSVTITDVNACTDSASITLNSPFVCTSVPSNLVSSNVLNSSADLTWTENGAASSWEISYGTSGFTAGQGTEVTASNPNTLSGLTAGTTYDWYVRSICSVGDTSAWSSVSSFTTSSNVCGPFTTPYVENFENAGLMPNCWTQPATNQKDWNFGSGTAAAYGPTSGYGGSGYYAWIDDSSPHASSTEMVSPYIDLSGLADPSLEFAFWSEGHTVPAQTFFLHIDVDTGNGFNTVMTFDVQNNGWELMRVSLSSYVNKVVRIKFTGEEIGSRPKKDIAIDRIRIADAICAVPSNLLSSNVLSSGVDLAWDENGVASSWEISYGTSGFTAGQGTEVVASNPYSLSGLHTETVYDWYVRSICSIGDTSAWSSVSSFTTICAIFTSPYAENFENAGVIPSCWEQGSVNQKDWKFGTGTAAAYGPTSGYGGSGYYAWIDDDSPHASSTEMISPYIDLSGLTDPILEFGFWSEGHTVPAQTFLLHVDVDTGNGFNTIKTFDVQNTGWELMRVSLSSYANQVVRLKFRGQEIGSRPKKDIAIDRIRIADAICAVPSNLLSSNVLSSAVDLSWDENGLSTSWEISYGTSGFTAGQGTEIVSSNPYNLNGLNAETSYDWYVRSICSVGDTSAWSSVSSFTTICAIFTTPYTEDFENAGLIPSCWTQPSSNQKDWRFGTGSAAAYGPTSGYGGTGYYAWIDDDSPHASSTEMISPYIDLSGLADPSLEFGFWSEGHTVPAQTFLLHIDVDSGNGFNTVMTFDVQNTGWELMRVSLSNYVNKVVRIKFTGEEIGSRPKKDIAIDRIRIADAICALPSNLLSSNVLSSSVDLLWNENGVANSWEISYGTNGFSAGQGTKVVVSNPYALFGLTAGTTYDWYVRSICSVGDTSAWSSVSSFTTACAPITSPYIENFENAGVIPSCWTQSGSNQKDWRFGTGSAAAYGPTSGYGGSGYYAWIDDSSPHASSTEMISPYIDLSGLADPSLEFGFWSEGHTVPAQTTLLHIDVDTGNGFNTLKTFNVQNTGWELMRVSLLSYVNKVVRIKFTGEEIGSRAKKDIAIDNIRIDDIICSVPSNLVSSNLLYTSVDLAWVENGAATSWEVSYGASGFTAGQGTEEVVTNSYSLSGLTAETAYDWYVRSICSIGDTSAWSSVSSITTVCAPLTSPFFENFENSGVIPSCWTQSGSNQKDWRFGTGSAAAYGPTSGYGGAGYYAWIDDSSPHASSTEMISPYIDLSGLADPSLEFGFWSEGHTVPAQTTLLHIDVDTGNGFNTVKTFNVQNTGWELMRVSLSDYASQIVRIKFTGEEIGSRAKKDIAIDNIRIDDIICFVPSNLVNSNILTNSVDLAWVENGAATSWEISYGTIGFSTGQGTEVLATNPYSLSGLNAGNSYDWYVRSICSVGDTSDWSDGSNFTTQSAASSSPVFRVKEDFEVKEITVEVFPNPNTGEFNLMLNQDKLYDVKIMDLRGQVVYAKPAVEFQRNRIQEIDVNYLSKGVYFLKLESDDDLKVERIVIQ